MIALVDHVARAVSPDAQGAPHRDRRQRERRRPQRRAGRARRRASRRRPAWTSQPLPALSREQVEALRKERDDLRDQLLRKRAEFENYRKRVERDRAAGRPPTPPPPCSRPLVPTLDNLDRALEAAGAESTLREGVELTRRELLAPARAPGRDDRGSRRASRSTRSAIRRSPTRRRRARRTAPSSRSSARATPSRTACSARPWSRWPRADEGARRRRAGRGTLRRLLVERERGRSWVRSSASTSGRRTPAWP